MSATPEHRAAAYIAAMGPAVQGHGGDDHTYKVAATLLRDFALPDADALSLLREWNETCAPPWTERELARKLANVAKYGRHAPGSKLTEEQPRLRVFDSPEDALDAFLRALGERAPHDVVGWLACELFDALKPRWSRAPRKGSPDHRKILRAQRRDAFLAAIGAYLALDPRTRPRRDERISWLLGQAAREHFACWRANLSDEIPFCHDAFDLLAAPQGDGSAQRQRIHPLVQLPEDPETIYARKEAVEQFDASLSSPLERAIFNEPFSVSEDEVAQRVGTTRKTVKSTRGRIRAKARAWGDEQNGVVERAA